jgi:O-antigen ligase
MPPQLALVLCAGTVTLFLWHERRESRGVSFAAWIPALWMLAISSKPLAYWFGISGSNESGSALDRILLTGLGIAAIAVLVRRRFDWVRVLRRHGWLVMLLFYMLASILWSDIPLIAARRWAREVVVVIMGLVILSEADPRQTLVSVLRRSAYILVPASLLLIKYYPSLGVDYGRWSGEEMWTGVTLHKNTLGRLCFISAFFLLWSLYSRWHQSSERGARKRSWADFGVLLMTFFLLRGPGNAYSATSLGTLATGIVLFLALAWMRRMNWSLPRAIVLSLVLLLLGLGVSTPYVAGGILGRMTGALGRDATFTGRTDTWEELVVVVNQHPLVGSGFGSFWTTARRDYYEMSHGHNGYLDVLLELGAFGLLLYASWLVSLAWRLTPVLDRDFEWASFGVCLVVMGLMYNVTESALSSFNEQMTAMLVLVPFVVLRGSAPAPGSTVRTRRRRVRGGQADPGATPPSANSSRASTPALLPPYAMPLRSQSKAVG